MLSKQLKDSQRHQRQPKTSKTAKDIKDSQSRLNYFCREREFLNGRTESTSAPPSTTIDHVQVAEIEKNSMTLSIKISGKSLDQKTIKTKALLDTGAGGKFINQNFVQNQKIKTKNLEHPIEVFNVDGTPNKQGTITKYTQLDLMINGYT